MNSHDGVMKRQVHMHACLATCRQTSDRRMSSQPRPTRGKLLCDLRARFPVRLRSRLGTCMRRDPRYLCLPFMRAACSRAGRENSSMWEEPPLSAQAFCGFGAQLVRSTRACAGAFTGDRSTSVVGTKPTSQDPSPIALSARTGVDAA